MRFVHVSAALVGLTLSLACGGLGGGGSSEAQRLCDHLGQELEADCSSFGVGSTVTINDMAVTVTAVRTETGEQKVSNDDERSAMKASGGNVLVVEAMVENTTPSRSGLGFGFTAFSGDGLRIFPAAHNARKLSEGREGWMDYWDDDKIGPGKSRPILLAFPVPTTGVEGTKLILQRNEKRPDPMDPRGRMKKFVEELYVVDLGPPT